MNKEINDAVLKFIPISDIVALMKINSRISFLATLMVGKSVDEIVRMSELGIKNDKGDRLIRFCSEAEFAVMKTYLQLPHRRHYT